MLSIELRFATFVWICFPCRNNTSRTRFFLNDDAFTLGNLEEDLRRNFHSVSLITELKIKKLGTTLTKLSGKLQKIKIFNSSRCTGSRRIKDIWVFPQKSPFQENSIHECYFYSVFRSYCPIQRYLQILFHFCGN